MTRQSGFSLIEFMIAITVSLIILAALTSTFVANSRARTELDRANQQIENGRYALAVLSDDLELAGYLSQLNLATAKLGGPAGKPRPCATTLSALMSALPVHIQGYDNVPDANADGKADIAAVDDDGTAATDLDCLPNDVKPDTDILVIRHVSTCVGGTANCAIVAGAPYFQASLCETELSDLTEWDTPFINVRKAFRLNFAPTAQVTTPATDLDRTQRDCATPAVLRRYLVHIYFVANNDKAGDGIPTLKRAELGVVGGAVAFEIASLANGIENFQVEYGIDCNANPPVDCNGDAAVDQMDGAPDATTASPDKYNRADPTAPFANCAANANCKSNWLDVTSAKVSVLARNPVVTRNYTDTKVYSLGKMASGAVQCAKLSGGNCVAFNDGYRRHVYQTALRLVNPATRRDQ